jgi:hypothetical protein
MVFLTFLWVKCEIFIFIVNLTLSHKREALIDAGRNFWNIPFISLDHCTVAVFVKVQKPGHDSQKHFKWQITCITPHHHVFAQCDETVKQLVGKIFL